MHATTIIMLLATAFAIFITTTTTFRGERKGAVIGWGIALVILFGACLGLGAVAHIHTGDGESVGRVNAIETTGIFHKTTQVYIKTDREASTDDVYCSRSPEVAEQLRGFVDSGELVRITYTDHVSWAPECPWAIFLEDNAGGYITAVRPA